MKPKILSKRVEYKCDWLKIERVKLKLPTGKIVKWEVPIVADFVAIVPIDNRGNIYLVKEWRVAWGKEIIQIPAGGCGGNNEKAILKKARNELREEVGLDAKKWQKLLSCPVGPRMKLGAHLYLATDLFESKKEKEDTEIIEVIKMPFPKASKLFLSGKILTTSYTILGMLLAKEKLKL